MACLNDLPSELLHLICQQEPRGSKVQFAPRLVNRQFADIAAEYIVPWISLSWAHDSFDDYLEFLACRPRIAKGVKAVQFNTDRLRHLKTYAEWDEQRRVADGIDAEAEFSGDLRDYRPRTAYTEEVSPRQLRWQGRESRKADMARQGVDTKKQLQHAWQCYQRTFGAQKLLDEGDFVYEKMKALFVLCPNIGDLLLNGEDEFASNTE